MEQMLLEATLRHREDKELIWNSQHSFTKSKSCLTNLGAFYDRVITSGDKGKIADERIKCPLSKFADGTKLSGVVDIHEERDVIQKGLDNFEKWIHGNLMRFNKTEYKMLRLG
ncbi:rna-directed dna polymerase from mobile element jockey-like [Pitangus sulphuratus]|nr:rna-directed dna polymerase from mobile element jockey-like [Pitangus sulphuratus]